MLKDVSFLGTTLGGLFPSDDGERGLRLRSIGQEADMHPFAVNKRHRRRDQRLDGSGGEDERPVRRHAQPATGHDEQDAADGGADGRGLEGLGGLLRLRHCAFLVRAILLKGKGKGESKAHARGPFAWGVGSLQIWRRRFWRIFVWRPTTTTSKKRHQCTDNAYSMYKYALEAGLTRESGIAFALMLICGICLDGLRPKWPVETWGWACGMLHLPLGDGRKGRKGSLRNLETRMLGR